MQKKERRGDLEQPSEETNLAHTVTFAFLASGITLWYVAAAILKMDIESLRRLGPCLMDESYGVGTASFLDSEVTPTADTSTVRRKLPSVELQLRTR